MNRRIITLIFILVTLIIVFIVVMKNGNHADENLAKCIASKSTLYVATGCVACDYQEKLFGTSFKYFNAIDCAVTPESCQDIQATPTWIINNEKIVGVQTIEKLKQLTNC